MACHAGKYPLLLKEIYHVRLTHTRVHVHLKMSLLETVSRGFFSSNHSGTEPFGTIEQAYYRLSPNYTASVNALKETQSSDIKEWPAHTTKLKMEDHYSL